MNENNHISNDWTDGPREITKDELPRISFVIATYNSGPFVEEAIKSILKQDYPLDKIEIFGDEIGKMLSGLINSIKKSVN